MNLKSLMPYGVIVGSAAIVAGISYATKSSSLAEVSSDNFGTFRRDVLKAVDEEGEGFEYRDRVKAGIMGDVNTRLQRTVAPYMCVLGSRIENLKDPEAVELFDHIMKGFAKTGLKVTL